MGIRPGDRCAVQQGELFSSRPVQGLRQSVRAASTRRDGTPWAAQQGPGVKRWAWPNRPLKSNWCCFGLGANRQLARRCRRRVIINTTVSCPVQLRDPKPGPVLVIAAGQGRHRPRPVVPGLSASPAASDRVAVDAGGAAEAIEGRAAAPWDRQSSPSPRHGLPAGQHHRPIGRQQQGLRAPGQGLVRSALRWPGRL